MLILRILAILAICVMILLVLLILGLNEGKPWNIHKYIDFKPGTHPKCRDLGEISAFEKGSRLEINICVYVPLFKLNIDNIMNIININIDNIDNIGLEPQKPSQMQRSR